MTNQPVNQKKNERDEKGLPPDPETLNTSDPQEEMEGPVSSVMQNIKHTAEENDTENKEEATRRKDENT